MEKIYCLETQVGDKVIYNVLLFKFSPHLCKRPIEKRLCPCGYNFQTEKKQYGLGIIGRILPKGQYFLWRIRDLQSKHM